MRQLRAAVIGLGAMGRNHVRVLRELEGVHLVGAVEPLEQDPDPRLGVPVVSRLDEFLDHIDMAVVAVPTADHVSVGLQLADAGVHALVEKPLAEDVAGAGVLTSAFANAGIVGCVGHVERYNAALRSLRQRLEGGEGGAIFQIATRRQGPFPHRIRDVGAVKDLATHDIDLTAWVAGAPYAAVAARTAHKTGRQYEDLVAATGTLTDGTITNHLVNWLTPTKERVTVVTAERGCFVADTLTADLTFYANGDVATTWDAISQFRGVSEGDMVRYAIAKPEPLVVELTAFRDAVLGRHATVVTMEEGTAAVAVAEALIESARRGTTVTLTDRSPAAPTAPSRDRTDRR